MLTKSKGTLVATALAIAVVGGGSLAVVRGLSSGPENAAPAALPVAAGPGVTAAPAAGGGRGDGATAASLPADDGQDAGGQAGTAGPGQSGTGQSGPGQSGTGQPGTWQPGTGQPTAAGIPAGVTPASSLPAAAGQGEPGPLPAGAVAADGAVPGALPRLRALAAERQATTALPHSPQLLAALAGQQGAQQVTDPAAASAGQPGAASATASSPPANPVASPLAGSTGGSTTTASTTTASTTAGGTTAATPATGPGLSAAATRTPARLAGLDVAGFQHPVTKQYPGGTPVSWPKVATAGYKYAAIKATEGDYYVNPWAAGDLTGAKASGLDVTPYHFAIPNASGGVPQARFAVEYSGYATGRQMLPPMLDIEYDPYVSSDHTNSCYGLTAKQMTAWIGGFVTETRTLTGQYPVIYTTANWWNTCTGGSTAFTADPMWVAAYGFTSPPMPAGWHSWMFWQYTSGGTVPGVATRDSTDVDYFSPLMVGLIDPGGQAVKTRSQVTVSVAALGALAGETLKFTVRGLPPGLSVTATGTITGTVAVAAAQLVPTAYSVRLAAANAAGETETVTFAWNVTPSCARSIRASTCRGG